MASQRCEKGINTAKQRRRRESVVPARTVNSDEGNNKERERERERQEARYHEPKIESENSSEGSELAI